MENITTTPTMPYNPDKDLNNMSCTNKSLNPIYVYEATKDINVNTVLDTSVLNENESLLNNNEIY